MFAHPMCRLTHGTGRAWTGCTNDFGKYLTNQEPKLGLEHFFVIISSKNGRVDFVYQSNIP